MSNVKCWILIFECQMSIRLNLLSERTSGVSPIIFFTSTPYGPWDKKSDVANTRADTEFRRPFRCFDFTRESNQMLGLEEPPIYYIFYIILWPPKLFSFFFIFYLPEVINLDRNACKWRGGMFNVNVKNAGSQKLSNAYKVTRISCCISPNVK